MSSIIDTFRSCGVSVEGSKSKEVIKTPEAKLMDTLMAKMEPEFSALGQDFVRGLTKCANEGKTDDFVSGLHEARQKIEELKIEEGKPLVTKVLDILDDKENTGLTFDKRMEVAEKVVQGATIEYSKDDVQTQTQADWQQNDAQNNHGVGSDDNINKNGHDNPLAGCNAKSSQGANLPNTPTANSNESGISR